MGGLQDRLQQGLAQPQAESFSTLWLLPPAGGTPKGPIQGTKTQPFLGGFLSRSHTWIPCLTPGWLRLLQPPALK